MSYIYFLSVWLILVVFLFLIFSLSFSFSFSSFSKGSPFECGFQPFSFFGNSFSMPFFIVSLMFLLFDVEIILVCFFPFSHFFYSCVSVYWVVVLLILVATCYEWFKGILSWV